MNLDVDLHGLRLGDPGPGLVLAVGGYEPPGLACALAVGASIVGARRADRLALLSCQSSLAIGDLLLVDASWRECHRWTLPRETFEDTNPHETAWAGDSLDEVATRDCAAILKRLADSDERLFAGADGGIAVFDFAEGMDFDELPRLNEIAKDRGATAVACTALRDVQGSPYPLESYAELAIRICVERGVDLAECATAIVAMEGNPCGDHLARTLA